MQNTKWLLVCVIGASLGLSDAAHAKKDKQELDGIELTGIQSFDKVFRQVDGIDKRLSGAERDLKSGQRELNTSLELRKGAPFSDAISELQARAGDKLDLSMRSGAVPTLQVTDAVPSNVQHSVDAFNALTLDVSNALEGLAGIGPEIDALVRETRNMPANLKNEFKKDNSNLLGMLLEFPQTSKLLTHDLAVTRELPSRATSVTNEMTSLLDVAASGFRGGSGAGRGDTNRGTPSAAPQPRRRGSGAQPEPKPSRSRAGN